MSRSLPPAAVFAERMVRQGLADRPDRDALAATRRCVAIQAQDVPAARLAVRARSTATTALSVDATTAVPVDATATAELARTWLMRATLHWVPTVDLPWLLRLFGPRVWAKHAPVRRSRGITDEMVDASTPLVVAALADGPSGRGHILQYLGSHGLDVPTEDNAAAHLFIALAARGVLVRAPDHGRQPVYDLAARWGRDAPRGPDGDDAVVELMTRYFAAFAPASVHDAAAWSGLPIGTVRPVVQDLPTSEVGRDGSDRPLLRLDAPPDVPTRPVVRLMGGWDSYLMGYRHRAGWLSEPHAKHVVDGGWLHPSVCVNGRLVGRWRLTANGAAVHVEMLPGHRSPARRALAAEVADVGRFLDRDLVLAGVTELT